MSQGFDAGVEPGGLYSSHEIKLLIGYLLIGAGEPMPRGDVLDVICGGGMANFFNTSAAIDELIQLDNLIEQDDGTLLLTETGSQAASLLADRLPYTLRERSVAAALRLLSRRRHERDNDVTIVPAEGTNGFVVTCTVGKEQPPLLSFSLLVADEYQADMVRENFLRDPLLLYQSTLSVLTGGVQSATADRLVLELG